MTTDVSICNAALLMIGADDINSLSDNTVNAKVCNALYADTRSLVLQYHPWRFSLKQTDLGGAVTASPLFDWTYSFQIPVDALRIITMEKSADYEIYGDKIYSNKQITRIIYQALIDENKMPSYFVRVLQFQMAKLLSMSLQEDAAKMKMFSDAADKELVRARNIDSQQQVAVAIPDTNFTFINVRG